MDITTMLVPNNGYSERVLTETISEISTYNYPVTQNWLKIVNTTQYDLDFEAGKLVNRTLKAYQTFEGFADFKTLIIKPSTEISIEITTRELESAERPLNELWKFGILQESSGGDMVLNGDTLGTSAASIEETGTSVSFAFTVDTTADVLHSWYNGTFDASVVVTSTEGLAEIVSCVVEEGVGTCTLTYSGTFAEADTVVLTITGGTKLGYEIADLELTDTLIA